MVEIIKDNVLSYKGYRFLYQGGHRQFDYLQGKLEPSNVSINNFYQNIKSRKEYCMSNGIDYVHIVYPAKPVVKKGFLPYKEQESLESMFLRYYKSNENSDIAESIYYPSVDLNKVDSESRECNTFKFDDTHMTDFGNLVVVKNVLGTYFNLNADIEDDFLIEPIYERGDLAKMLSLTDKKQSDKYFFKGNYIKIDNLRWLEGNKGNIVLLQSTEITNGKSLLVFGDSFAKSSLDFYLARFEYIMYFRSPFFHKDICHLFNPDAVITSNTERYLAKVNLDDSANPIGLLSGEDSQKFSLAFQKMYEAYLGKHYYLKNFNKWKNEPKQTNLYFSDFGLAYLKGQIKVISSRTREIEVLSKNATIIFRPRLNNVNGGRISLRLETSVGGKFNISYDGKNFESKKITQGSNYLHFPIPRHLPKIIIKPLNVAGSIIIEELKLVDAIY